VRVVLRLVSDDGCITFFDWFMLFVEVLFDSVLSPCVLFFTDVCWYVDGCYPPCSAGCLHRGRLLFFFGLA